MFSGGERETRQIHFSITGEFLTNFFRERYWDDKLSLKDISDMISETLPVIDTFTSKDKESFIQDIIEGRKKLVGVNEFELVEDGKEIRTFKEQLQKMQDKETIEKIKKDIENNPLSYIDIYSTRKSFKSALHKNLTLEETRHYFITPDASPGDYGAQKAWDSGITSTRYSERILALMETYEEVRYDKQENRQ